MLVSLYKCTVFTIQVYSIHLPWSALVFNHKHLCEYLTSPFIMKYLGIDCIQALVQLQMLVSLHRFYSIHNTGVQSELSSRVTK